jgi:rubredoxin/uncharacterized membrane protein
MKEWKCEICGYIHEGQEPPGQCPSCQAPKEKFTALTDGQAEQPGKKDETAQEAKPAAAPMLAATKKNRRWRCQVCGYVHEGEAPPDKCPVCKAPAEQFEELDEKGKPIKNKPAAPVEKIGIIARILLGMHVHPILAHFPNGILPMVVLFIAVSIFLRSGTSEFIDKAADLDTCIFYGLIFVLITMPFVLASGFLEWKKRYQGARTMLFFTKICCGLLATFCLVALVLWGWFEGHQVMLDARSRLIYFIVAVVMLLAVAMAGHLGGRLVFKDRGR